MKKLVKVIKNNILGFVIGAVLFGGIGIAVAVQSNIASSDIAYTNSKNANVTSVKQAVDDLYGKVKDTEELSTKLDRYAELVPRFVKSCETSNYLTCQVINAFKTNSVEYGVFYHNGSITGKTAGIDTSTTILDAEDYSFRYSGASSKVSNWVCFGSTATTCPDANKYRIIGAFTFDDGETYHVKLIMSTAYSTSSAWDFNGSNTWTKPASLRSTLNGSYLNGLTTTWNKLIYSATWKVGGADYASIVAATVKTCYTNEMASLGGTNKPTTGDVDENGAYIDTAKVALMYASDYWYAAAPKYWKTKLNITSSSSYWSGRNDDWLFMSGKGQLTLTRRGDNTSEIIGVPYNGGFFNQGVSSQNIVTRPTFYLNSNVSVSSGTGTSTDPWRIKLS